MLNRTSSWRTGQTAQPVALAQSAVRRLVAIPHRIEGDELLDDAGHDLAELADSLRDVRRVNQLFGGLRTVRTQLPRLLAATSPERPVTILDLATGSADIPINAVRWARQQGREVEITASDYSADILAIAARRVAGYPNIHVLQCDAREVPFADASFDIVLCSLALHHFAPPDAVRVLAEMDRVSRVGFIVNDLARSRPGYIGAWLVGRLATRNRITRHDAPLSALRAYTPGELRALLDRAGVADVEVRSSPWFRMSATRIHGYPGQPGEQTPPVVAARVQAGAPS
ncbi:MAG: methyltransferase domain-containing protein [Chloroflexota bacterium]|nr:methyltransferase domain-containing protein [Chloroflexota bacterium]